MHFYFEGHVLCISHILPFDVFQEKYATFFKQVFISTKTNIASYRSYVFIFVYFIHNCYN